MTDTVTISAAEYRALLNARQDLEDSRLLGEVQRKLAAGEEETLSEAELAEYLAAATPLQFWRTQRGLTQVALAAAIGVSQPYIAQLELGQRTGDVATLLRLARVLRLRLEDLVVEDAADPQ
jgi:DNA-binding XRE family transcriptional regulator